MPFRYIQPFAGSGYILGSSIITNPNYDSAVAGTFNSESRLTTGEYNEIGLMIPTLGRTRRLTFIFNYRNERYRTGGTGDYGNFGLKTEKIEIGIAMQGYDLIELTGLPTVVK